MGKKLLALLCVSLLLCASALAAPRFHAVKLLVESYSIDGVSIEAGTQAVLRLTVRNTNETLSAGNCVFTLSDPTGSLIPRGTEGAAGVYVQEIPRSGVAEIAFLLEALPDALPGSKRLTLQAEYETAQGSPGLVTADIYIPVSQKVRLEHGVVRLPDKATQGDTVTCAVDFLNMGKGSVYNVLMRFSVPGFDGGSAVLVGNIPPGEQKSGRANLLAAAPDGQYGPVEGTVLLSWEDAAGTVYEKELPLSSEIVRRKSMEELAAATEETDEKDGNLLQLVLIGGGAFLAGGGMGFLVMRSVQAVRQRKRDEELL